MTIPLSLVSGYTANSTLINILTNVRQELLESGDAIISVALCLAGVLTLFTLVKTTVDIASGKPTRAMTIIRPFIFITLIASFRIMVLGPLDYTCAIINKGFTSITTECASDNLSIFFDQVKRDAKAWEQKQKTRDSILVDTQLTENSKPSVVDDGTSATSKNWLLTRLQIAASYFCGLVLGSLTTIISFFIVLIYQLIGMVLIVLSHLLLAILAIMGPFVFALALVPSLNGIWQWVASYIQISLWGVMASVINLVVQRTLTLCGTAVLGGDFNIDYSGALGKINDTLMVGSNGTYMLSVTIVSLAGICLLLATPKICGMIVKATGANEAFGFGKKATQKGGAMLISQAGTTGRIAGAILGGG